MAHPLYLAGCVTVKGPDSYEYEIEAGVPCHFPFTYTDDNGNTKEYNGCTDVDNDGHLWCGTSSSEVDYYDYGTTWGFCPTTDSCKRHTPGQSLNNPLA